MSSAKCTGSMKPVCTASTAAAPTASAAPTRTDQACRFLATGRGDVHPRRRRQGRLALTRRWTHATAGCCTNGDVLLAVTKNKTTIPAAGRPGDALNGKVVFEFKGTQSEVNTVQARRTDLTSAGS